VTFQEKIVLRALAFADIFSYPLEKQEIWEFLIRGKREEEKFKSFKEFERVLSRLLKNKKCQFKNGFFFLPKREEIVSLRKKREKNSYPKIRKAKKVAQFLKFIPWIRFIGITGSLARKNSDKKDDIDLFFITSPKRIWLTRGLVCFGLRLFGLYRQPDRIENMFCPNMFISGDALRIKPQDLFTAHQIALMRPVFERDRAYRQFLMANLWVRDFLPNALDAKNLFSVETTKSKQKSETKNTYPIPKFFSFLGLICHFGFYLLDFTFIEKFTKIFQLWYMRKRRTTEVVVDNLIKFHPQDHREWVLQKYQEKLERLKIN